MKVSRCIAMAVTLTGIGGLPAAAQIPQEAAPLLRIPLAGKNEASDYKGWIQWRKNLKTEYPTENGQYSATYEQTVVAGAPSQPGTEIPRVACNGSTRSENRTTDARGTNVGNETGRISGQGLLLIQFGTGTDEDRKQPFYRIAVVCPPARRPGDTAPAVARWGHGEMETFKQPYGPTNSSGREPVRPDVLRGQMEYESPDADPGNGTTGTEVLTWYFCRGQNCAPPAPPAPPPAKP
jgi:hypothetical protein